MVIEGFMIEMSAKEIIAHLHARAKLHEEQAEDVARRVRERLEREPPRGKHEEPDPSLDDVHEARDRARVLRFLADHVPPEATFQLDPNDLAFLEFVERAGYLSRRRRR